MVARLTVSPERIDAECICLAVQRAARAIGRRYDEALRPLDLSNGQFALLTTVAGLQRASIQTLGERLAMDRTTVTAALKPLERRGLVSIEAAEQDRRVREVSLTPTGNALLRRATAVWEHAQRAALQRLAPAAVAKTLAALRQLV